MQKQIIENNQTIKKISDTLNFEITQTPRGNFHLINEIDGIPSYMILLLLKISGLQVKGKFGKSLFASTFRYKHVDFMIEDNRGTRCRILSAQKDEQSILFAKEIITKVIEACELLEPELSAKLRRIAISGNFYIHNSYILLIRYFYRLGRNLKKEIDRRENGPESDSIPAVFEFIYDTTLDIEQIAFSLLVTFFSVTDFLFLIFYLMKEPSPSWHDCMKFRKLYWHEKFKKVLNIDDDEIRALFEKLLEFKDMYRNPFSHGMVGKNSFLVPMDYVGLIPISYKTFHSDYTFYGIDSKNAGDLLNTTQAFLNRLENLEPYSFYMKFLSVALPIPVGREKLEELRAEMTDMANFTEFINDKAQYQDMIDNFDY